jgi:hypothetical protein
MRKRRKPWLLVAGLLFVGAALLMSMGGAPKRPPPHVHLPQYMDEQAANRLHRRQTLPKFVVAPEKSADQPARDEPAMRDPLIAALPSTVKRAAVVVEANALRHSPVGQLLIDCFLADQPGALDKLKRESGIDFLEDVDRVGAVDDTFLVTGRFADAKWEKILEHAQPSALNAHTTLWEGQQHGDQVAATWNQQMLIVGPDRSAITAVVDRLEGVTPPQPPVLSERDSYGEIYGVVTPAALAQMLGHDQPAIALRLRTVLDRVTLHVDATHDVGIVADAHGGPDADDLGKTVGGALALGRLAALAQSNRDLAAVLDYARVVPRDDRAGFRTELALPLPFLKEKLLDCAGRKKRGNDGGRAKE